MDQSVTSFFTKNAADGYARQYEIDHGPRLDAMLSHWGLVESLKGKRVLDVGGGLGFLGKRLGDVDYWVLDGTKTPATMRVCGGQWAFADLDHDHFGDATLWADVTISGGGEACWARARPNGFDVAFCLETLEHLTNPYHCLAEMKKLVKEGGDIYISIPHANVTHNYIYPGLMVDPNAFAQFLGQMALPVRDYWLWEKGWNAHHFKTENRPYREKTMLYPKSESKFLDATPVQMVNW